MKYFILSLISIITFNGILLRLGIPSEFLKILPILIISCILFNIFREQKLHKSAFLLFPYLLLVYYFNGLHGTIGVLQLLFGIYFFIYFNALVKKYLTSNDINKILTTFYIIQLIACLLKYMTLGINEGRGIGTVSLQAGTLTTSIVCYGFIYALHLLDVKRRLTGIIILITVAIFCVVNEKRGPFLFIPMLTILYFMLSKNKFSSLALLNGVP